MAKCTISIINIPYLLNILFCFLKMHIILSANIMSFKWKAFIRNIIYNILVLDLILFKDKNSI